MVREGYGRGDIGEHELVFSTDDCLTDKGYHGSIQMWILLLSLRLIMAKLSFSFST